MTVKIIKKGPDPKVTKKCVCQNCGATLQYTPNDVERYFTHYDYGGGSDEYAEFTCPSCKKKVQICQ